MARELPLFSDSLNYSYQVDLDGTVYDLQIRYNHREDYWHLSLSLPDSTPLVTGVRMVYDTDLVSRFKQLNLPEGALVLINDAGLEKMGRNDVLDSKLIYLTEEEVSEL